MKPKIALSFVAGVFAIITPAEVLGANRQVELLTFGSSHQAAATQVHQGDVGRAMLLDWSALATAPPTSHDIRHRQNAFIRTPTSRVSIWVRRRAARSDVPYVSFVPMGDCNPQTYRPSGIMGRSSEEHRRLLYPLVQEAACAAGLPVGLMDAMLIQESRYNPFALSPKGAFGLGQLMPATARQLNVDRYDLRGNLSGAARYLKAHLIRFGRADLALGAYNAGPARVSIVNGLPRIVETRDYVSTILRNWRLLESY